MYLIIYSLYLSGSLYKKHFEGSSMEENIRVGDTITFEGINFADIGKQMQQWVENNPELELSSNWFAGVARVTGYSLPCTVIKKPSS